MYVLLNASLYFFHKFKISDEINLNCLAIGMKVHNKPLVLSDSNALIEDTPPNSKLRLLHDYVNTKVPGFEGKSQQSYFLSLRS